MSSIKDSSNLIGSMFVDNPYSIDEYGSSVTFALIDDNEQTFLLNIVSLSLKDQQCESSNVFTIFFKHL